MCGVFMSVTMCIHLHGGQSSVCPLAALILSFELVTLTECESSPITSLDRQRASCIYSSLFASQKYKWIPLYKATNEGTEEVWI